MLPDNILIFIDSMVTDQKKTERAKVAKGKTFIILTASPNNGAAWGVLLICYDTVSGCGIRAGKTFTDLDVLYDN